MDITLKSEKISSYDIDAYIIVDHTQVVIAEIDGEIVGSGYGQIRDPERISLNKNNLDIYWFYLCKNLSSI